MNNPTGKFLMNFVSALPVKVEQLTESYRQLMKHSDRSSVLDAHRYAHGLAGSAATFGFETVEDAARKIEIMLKPMALGQSDAASLDRDAFASALQDLRDAAEAATRGSYHVSQSTETPGLPDYWKNETIYLLEDDPALLKEWSMQLRRLGYETREFESLAALELALVAKLPTAILADEHLADGRTSDFLTKRRNAGQNTPPVIAVSNDGDFETRIEAVRAGVHAFFTKPIDIASLAVYLANISHPEDVEVRRVILVDDAHVVAEYHASLLRDAGMHVDVVFDPLTLMQYIGARVPDLILMDMYMPGCNGLELAAVLRQQDAYAGIPIVFLSGEGDLGRQMEALDIGGDDFLTKPVDPVRLVSAVSARIKRARIVRGLMTHDSLTGLLNHTSVKEALEREVQQARRTRMELNTIILDVDHFKNVNDRFGHQAGDRVLKTLAQMLRKRLGRSAVIGRYGGEEFIAVLPGITSNDARQIVEELRTDFGGVDFYSDNNVFRVTFSTGIATFPAHADSANGLIRAADHALYHAKTEGRDRTVLAE